jgi:hypothetical protein
MIHPDTTLRMVNPQIGYGVFATAFIPMGTIVYVMDSLEIRIPADSQLRLDPRYQHIINRYAIIEPDGSLTLSWDIAKYVNHCCHYNTISTGYGFEIAVADIAAGEELTDDYAIFNMEHDVTLLCHHPDCRQSVARTDFDPQVKQWDADIQRALAHLSQVGQPLLPYLDPETERELHLYLDTGQFYKSIVALKKQAPVGPAYPQPTMIRQPEPLLPLDN